MTFSVASLVVRLSMRPLEMHCSNERPSAVLRAVPDLISSDSHSLNREPLVFAKDRKANDHSLVCLAFVNFKRRRMSTAILPAIQREIIRYGVSAFLAFGVVGSMLCCLMFTRNSYRRTPSSVYLLSLSIFSAVFLIWTIAPVLYTLNHPDPQTSSVLYCKVRQYGSHALSLQNRYVVVFATIDRYLLTRASVRLRSLSSLKAARVLVCLTPIVCFAMASHMPILTELRNGVCGMYGAYKFVYAIYQNITLGLTPPILMTIFGVVTMRSLRHRHENFQVRTRQRDRHLATMVAAEVIITVLTTIPFSINLLYNAVTSYETNKSTERQAIESFCTFLSQFCIYFIAVTPFYLFMYVSAPFRNEFICLVVNCWKRCTNSPTRVNPWSFGHNTTTQMEPTNTHR